MGASGSRTPAPAQSPLLPQVALPPVSTTCTGHYIWVLTSLPGGWVHGAGPVHQITLLRNVCGGLPWGAHWAPFKLGGDNTAPHPTPPPTPTQTTWWMAS